MTSNPITFFVSTIMSQIIGFGVGVLFRDLPLAALLSHACIAFGIALWLNLPPPWRALNLLIPFTPLFTMHPGALVIILLAFTLLYIPTFWTHVPFYPSSRSAYEAVLRELPKDRHFRFIDLGCGFGTMLIWLSKKCPNGSFFGVEVSPMSFLVAKLKSLFAKNVTIEAKSLWTVPLKDYDFVYAFLSPTPMPNLWKKASREMEEGTVFLVNTFQVQAPADREIALGDERQDRLYVYYMKAS